MTYWSAHTPLPLLEQGRAAHGGALVAKAVELGYPALGLTDHGVMRRGGRAVHVLPQGRHRAAARASRPTCASTGPRASGRPPCTWGCWPRPRPATATWSAWSTSRHRQFRYQPVLDLADLAEAGRDGRLDGRGGHVRVLVRPAADLLREGDPVAARNLLVALDGWFDQLYVELQHHNIVDDDPRRPTARGAAGRARRRAGPAGRASPRTATTASPRTAADHDVMKRLMSWSDDPDDAVFPGDGYHMVGQRWMRERYAARHPGAGLRGPGRPVRPGQGGHPRAGRLQGGACPTWAGTRTRAARAGAGGCWSAAWRRQAGRPRKQQATCGRIGEEAGGRRRRRDGRLPAADRRRVRLHARGGHHLQRARLRGSARTCAGCWASPASTPEVEAALRPVPVQRPHEAARHRHRRRAPPAPAGDRLPARRYHVATSPPGGRWGWRRPTAEPEGRLLVRWKMHARQTGGNPDQRARTRCSSAS